MTTCLSPALRFGLLAFLTALLPSVIPAQTQITYQKGLPVPVASPELRARAEACAPATALRDLEWNNVRALIENGGALWYNRAIDRGAHFVPKEEGVSVVYGGCLLYTSPSPRD